MFAGHITGGRNGVFTRDCGVGTIIGGVDLVQDLVARVDDVGPKGKVLGEGKLHSGAT